MFQQVYYDHVTSLNGFSVAVERDVSKETGRRWRGANGCQGGGMMERQLQRLDEPGKNQRGAGGGEVTAAVQQVAETRGGEERRALTVAAG